MKNPDKNKLNEVEMAEGYQTLAYEQKEFARLTQGIEQEVIQKF